MFRTIVISATLFLGVSAVAVADVYRWVDEHGSVHYSDQWVPGSELIKSVKQRPVPESNGSSVASERARLTAAAGQASAQVVQQDAARTVKDDVAHTRVQQCKEARERYAKSIEARRIYTLGPGGERQVMSDEDADAYRVKALTDVKDLCANVADATAITQTGTATKPEAR